MSTLAQSQLTQFWQIPRHRTLSYSSPRHVSSRLAPSGETCKYAKAPSRHTHTHKGRDSLPIDMLLFVMYVVVVARPNSEIPEGLMI
jgi:hypothetical protein